MEASRAPHPFPDPDAPPPASAVVRLIRRWGERLPAGERGRASMAGTAASAVADIEERLGPVLSRPLREHGLEPLAKHVERNPIAALAGAVVAGWLARRLLR